MALDLPLPRQILAHAHWTLGGEKMSKSLGNVVDPFFAIERFGVDGLRYFLAYNGGIKDDAMYDNSLIIDQYTKHLQGSLGNLASRIVRGKGWNIRRAVQQHEVSNAGLAKTLITSLEGLQALSARLLDEQLDTRNPLVAIMKNIKMVRSCHFLTAKKHAVQYWIELTCLVRQIHTCRVPHHGTLHHPFLLISWSSIALYISAPSPFVSAVFYCNRTCLQR